MTKRQIYAAVFSILALPLLRVAPAYAHGDRVVPQVVDGVQQDNGIKYRTKFDVSNISYYVNTPITKATINFYQQNGSPWTVNIKDPVTGNPLSVSTYTFNFGSSQTVRIETLGTGVLNQGYAVIENREATDEYPDNREIGVTVYFEVLAPSGGAYNIIDTISVPISAPTVSWSFPVEIDDTPGASNLQTGYAIVDVSGLQNNITIDLYQTTTPLSGDGQVAAASFSIPVGSKAKAFGFLKLSDFFPTSTPTRFKGMAVASATGPVVFMSLLQTQMPILANAVQFATLVPTNLDGLRRNTFLYFPQGYSLDADLMIADYFRDESSEPDAYYEIPWDVLFQSGSTATGRFLVPQQGALIAPIGVKSYTTPDPFDAIDLNTLRGLTYSENPIDLGNGSAQLTQGYTFAVKTGLGRYAKVRIRNWVTYSGSDYVDLLVEVYVYR